MSETTTFRDQLRTASNDEILKANTRADLESGARELGLTDDTIGSAKTKADLLDLIIGAANLPDPALRGHSEIDSPVAAMWRLCDFLSAEASAKDEPAPRRKDVIAEAQRQGITFYTARTQYQSWFSATDRGSRRLADLDSVEVPKAVRAALFEDESD